MNYPIRLLTALLLSCLLSHKPAEATTRKPQAVLATLPPYCKDSGLSYNYERFGPRWHYWVSRMGELFNTIHHYCEGLLELRDARRLPKHSAEQRNALLRAIAEFNFILKYEDHVLRRFPLWPELLLRRGEAAVLLEDWALASSSYEQARTVKRDYWPAYLGWAEVLDGLKLRAQAREQILLGLQVDPSVESMRKAFVKYGGALKDIPERPIESPAPGAAASQASEPPAPSASSPASAPAPALTASTPSTS